MVKKEISSFAATYIIVGLFMILVLLYINGTQIYRVQGQNEIFKEKADENIRLAYQRDDLKKVKQIRSTPQSADQFNKENFDIYQPGEIVLVLPPEEKEQNIFDNLTPEQLELELKKKQPIIDQWKEIFFGE